MSQSWNTVRMPTPGDQVALHVIVKSKKTDVKVSKAIFVGPKPWGRKGEVDGHAVADRFKLFWGEIDLKSAFDFRES